MSIVVLGSINQDFILQAERMPLLGETVRARGFSVASGGKGANQAMAAARLGADVQFIGAVGEDDFGRSALVDFNCAGIDTHSIQVCPDCNTGTAVIGLVEGDNFILIDAGANARVMPEDVKAAEEHIASAEYLIVQFELPMETVRAALTLAKRHGTKVLLNPAPAQALDDFFFQHVDCITPNETECERITGIHIQSVEDAKRAALVLHAMGIRQVFVTLGALGVVYTDGERACHQPARGVQTVVDTTAAGDSFTAALAVGFTEGMSLEAAVFFASTVGALVTTKKGAQPSLPTRALVEEWLQREDPILCDG